MTTKAEREAKAWLKKTAWVEDRPQYPGSMLYHGPRHVRALFDVILKLRSDLNIERGRVEGMLEGHRLRKP